MEFACEETVVPFWGLFGAAWQKKGLFRALGAAKPSPQDRGGGHTMSAWGFNSHALPPQSLSWQACHHCFMSLSAGVVTPNRLGRRWWGRWERVRGYGQPYPPPVADPSAVAAQATLPDFGGWAAFLRPTSCPPSFLCPGPATAFSLSAQQVPASGL